MVTGDPAVHDANRPTGAGSLRRGLTLLTCLAESDRPLGLSELVVASGLDKATTHRLARVLVEAGYLSQDPGTKVYSLALRILDLGFAALARLDVRGLALPYMRALADRMDGASVSLTVLDGADVVYIERISQRRIAVNVDVQVGTRLPAHCTSTGKALLAALPAEEARALMQQRSLERMTPSTITSWRRLEAELRHIRADGYAVNDEETARGLRSLAAAVRNAEGRPVAALNVAASAAELTTAELVEAVGGGAVSAAQAISRHLGLRENEREEGDTAGRAVR